MIRLSFQSKTCLCVKNIYSKFQGTENIGAGNMAKLFGVSGIGFILLETVRSRSDTPKQFIVSGCCVDRFKHKNTEILYLVKQIIS